MKNAWQLCVVDVDYKKNRIHDSFFKNQYEVIKNRILAETDDDFPKNGDIAFIMNVTEKEIHATNNDKSYLQAIVWIERLGASFIIPFIFLRPILSEKDVIDVELKFGIDLKAFMS